MTDGRLLASSADGVSVEEQSRVETALLGAAHRGEIRLHVSSLAGPALSVGAHGAAPPVARLGASGSILRRRTGGRPVACGDGFRILTLALPGRTSLLGPGAAAIAPEQVMNRAVRGLQAGLRRLGMDPVYPGLDFVTVGGRTIAHLGFAESARGAVLFQATLACDRPLAESTRLLDALDPDGAVTTTPIPPATSTCLREIRPTRGEAAGDSTAAPGRGATSRDLAPERLAVLFADAWAEAAGLAALVVEPPVPGSEDGSGEPADGPFPPAPADTAVAVAASRLGIALAWARTVGGRIAEAAVGGDVLAPDGARARIADALAGSEARREAIGRTLEAAVDRERTWILGLTPGELADLVARAAGADA